MKTLILSILVSISALSFSLSACGKGKAIESLNPTEQGSNK